MYAHIIILISVGLKEVQLPLIQAPKTEISLSEYALYKTGRMSPDVVSDIRIVL